MKKKIIYFICSLMLLSIPIVIRLSLADTNELLESKEYEIKTNTIYAKPTSLNFSAGEFLSKIDYNNDYSNIKLLNSNNTELNYNSTLSTGSKLNVENTNYDIVVLGDVTGDGNINLADVSKLYNTYKNKASLSGNYLKAGKVTGGNKISLSDVSKVYNYYKGNSPFTYYDDNVRALSDQEIEEKTLERINEIRNTPNTDISGRDQSKIFYVSNDGDDNNDGKSPDRPIRTLGRIAYYSNATQNKITEGSTILFRDGDTFKGTLLINRDDLLIGSYGDISKGKPILSKSEYDGAKEGDWIEVKPNIWKYTLNGSDQVFTKNVGTLWFYCKSGNNNCTHSMTSIDKTFDYAQMITTNLDYDESNIEEDLTTLLTNDLEYYHVGHPAANTNDRKGKQLYVFSYGNPSKRFDEIEFNIGGHNININGHNNIYVDNLKIMYTGSHGIGAGTMSNLVVTNCEIGFIGGMVQNYNADSKKPTRFGNAVEIYGSVKDVDGFTVEDGMVVKNNYIYQCYDAGPTVQLSAKLNTGTIARMDKADFSNNVLEYNNYNIEYWMSTEEDSGEIFDESVIKNFNIENNIFRYAGIGLCSTRPDHAQSAHIKTWYHDKGSYNRIVGNLKIRNNLFYKQAEQAYFFRTNSHSNRYPIMLNNTFYGLYGDSFGYNSNDQYANALVFNDVILSNDIFSGNRFILLNKQDYDIRSDSGITGSATWNYDADTYTLTISGSGNMANYTEDNLPPWYKYKDYIYYIKVDENVTSLGDYAFYKLFYVKEFRIDAINLNDLSVSTINPNTGTNYTTFNMGNSSNGTTVIFGPKVTVIPRMLFKPMEDYNNHSFFKDVIFEGDNITQIKSYGLAFYRGPALTIPNHVTRVQGLGLGYNSAYIMIFPNTLTTIDEWGLAGNSKMEKVVYGSSINYIGNYTLNGYTKLKTLVIPHLNNTTAFEHALENVTQQIDVYGDESTQTWVNNQNTNYGKNLIYHNINTYTSKVTSNTGIDTSVVYDGTYTFTTNKKVNAFYKYVNDYGEEILFSGVNITNDGNTYTISDIKNDVYINLEN